MKAERFEPNIEAKYVFAGGESGPILRILRRTCIPDPSYPIGWINSAYFDTPDLYHLSEKVNSDYLKTKVRLRWYGTDNTDPVGEHTTAFLERKQKIGTHRVKERVPVQMKTEDLMSGAENFSAFAKALSRAGFEGWRPAGHLFPMIVIRYKRFRFLDPSRDVRISLDTRIGWTAVNPVFFPNHAPRINRVGVLEVKSETGELPMALVPIRDRLSPRSSFSKYEECWQIYSDPLYRREA
jgi:hypothetical protein